jgi:hypothetical protein
MNSIVLQSSKMPISIGKNSISTLDEVLEALINLRERIVLDE